MIEGCNNHPTVRATYHCGQCSKPVCDKCVVNSRFCSQACNAKYSTFMKDYKKPQDARPSGIVPTLFFLIVIGGAIYVTKVVLHLW